jgi:ABC transport system ATP-binding/permease protein
MNESMLKSFLQFIAAFTALSADDTKIISRKYLENYIEINFGKRLAKERLHEFEQYLEKFETNADINNILPSICNRINKEFTLKQKFYLLINLLNFLSLSPIDLATIGTTKSDAQVKVTLSLISQWLKLNDIDVENFKLFAAGQIHQIINKDVLLFVANEDPRISNIKFHKCNGLKGYLTFMYIKSVDILVFNFNGQSLLEMNGKPIFSKQTYFYQSGVVISGKEIAPIYYGEVLRVILHNKGFDGVNISATELEFTYPKSEQGIKNLSFSAESGELIGILGGSGVGKSTLIKILSGTLKPHKGKVLVNGYNIYSESDHLSGLVGVMHQEECLMEELTVFENLFYNAKLTLGNIPESELLQIVENKLFELDLYDCKDNMVGPPENRQLSGGQRKRLAIAMEIIREPKVLFADEPTSGLSSSDSLMVMQILKNVALGGRLVVVNIHQPSSDVYKLFDSVLIIDKGGLPVFHGNPIEAILHFKRVAYRVDKDQSGCEHCGNLKPELIFELLEDRTVDEMGQKNANRKLSPLEWYNLYNLEDVNKRKEKTNKDNMPLPNVLFKPQESYKQFFTFFRRNVLTKLRNIQFLVFAIVLPPILSVVISIFLRYAIPSTSVDATYTFFSNPNIPSFFLMCILSSLFFGLVISCEDIIRDRRVINRETYIGLNLRSFYNAKFATLIIISAIQTIAFAIPGVLILKVNGILLELWLIMFLLSIIGNLFGLILSSSLKSIVAIYILVPFLLIPQILFSGLVVRFDNLNSSIASSTKVPLVGEFMASRWAVEAVSVHQFMNNNYNKPLFSNNFRESELRYRLLHLIPELNQKLTVLRNNPVELSQNNIALLEDGFKSLSLGQNLPDFKIDYADEPKVLIDNLIDYLNSARLSIARSYSTVKFERDRNIERIYPNNEEGRLHMITARDAFHNKAIEDLLRNRHFSAPLIEFSGVLIQKSDPIYQISHSALGRSHFYAPYKYLGSSLIETYWYNTIFLFLMILILYFLFVYNFFPKVLSFDLKSYFQ